MGGIELRTRLLARATLKYPAWLWWGLRLALEAAIGVAGAALVTLPATGPLSSLPDWLTVGLGGGLAGPAVARMTIATVGKGSDAIPIGVASLYEPVRDAIEEQIEVIGADAQSAWINDFVLPRIRKKELTPESVGHQLRDYVRGLSAKRVTDKAAEIAWIDSTVADPTVDSDDKIEALIRRAIGELRAYRTVDRLLE